jgi:hypothetical protein
MKEYYHYTLESNVNAIRRSGVFDKDANFTTNQYYTAHEAGNGLCIQPHYIDCVLLFRDDGNYKYRGIVDSGKGGLPGGGTQYEHPSRPKPIAKRKISERDWTYF